MKQGSQVFNESKGFGFISDDEGGEDVLFISPALLPKDLNPVRGSEGYFDVEQDPKNSSKLRAANVRPV